MVKRRIFSGMWKWAKEEGKQPGPGEQRTGATPNGESSKREERGRLGEPEGRPPRFCPPMSSWWILNMKNEHRRRERGWSWITHAHGICTLVAFGCSGCFWLNRVFFSSIKAKSEIRGSRKSIWLGNFHGKEILWKQFSGTQSSVLNVCETIVGAVNRKIKQFKWGNSFSMTQIFRDNTVSWAECLFLGIVRSDWIWNATCVLTWIFQTKLYE